MSNSNTTKLKTESAKYITFTHCFVCTESCKRSRSTKPIEQCHAPLSNKPIKSLLIYLAKFIKIDLNIPADALICPTCFQHLVEYDEYVIKLLKSQQYLTALIEKSVKQRGGSASGSNSFSINNTTVPKQELCEDIETFSDLVESVYDDEESDISMGVSDKDDNSDEPKAKKRATCTICGAIVSDEEYLDLHMNLHNGKTETECRYCGKQYARKKNVIVHMQKHWNNKKFQCEKCGERFSETTVLYNHRLQHEAEEVPLVCPTCSQCFKTRRTYKSHLITHREDRPRFSCEHCGKTFVEKYTLKVHRRVHGEDGGVNPPGWRKSKSKAKDKTVINQLELLFNCIICDCKFSSKEQHMQHMERDHDVIQ